MKTIFALGVVALLTACAGPRPTIYIGPPDKSVMPKTITCHSSGSYITCHEF